MTPRSKTRLPVRLFNEAAWRLAREPARFAEDALLDKARKSTGLDDFGSEHFREGLGVLLQAYHGEARLTPFGRMMVRQQLLGILRARLSVVAAWKRDAQALEAPIRRPVFILGLPRTGTTALHHLLGRDPGNQVLEYWLAASPGPRPPPEQWSRDPRFKQAARGLRMTYWLDPGLRAIHDLTPEGPEECRHLLGQSFTDDTFDSNATLPSYTAWYAQRDMAPSYAWHRDVLKLVQSSGLARRWVLKYPAHLAHLQVLLATYPDACIVQTHRDPAEVLPSLCSLVTNWRGIFEEAVEVEKVARWQVEMWAARIEHALAVRDAANQAQFFDLHFHELHADPIAAIHRIYDHFGFGLSDEAERRMLAWVAGSLERRPDPHRYTAEQFGIDPGEIAERYAAYTGRFAVEGETDS